MKRISTLLLGLLLTGSLYSQAVDTNGLAGWNSLVNSYENWETGAFNQTKNNANPFDFGWGSYDMSTHFINADSLYIIKTVGGDYKKFAVDRLASGIWHFRVADIDGTNEVIKQVNRNIVSDKNFFYYSIDTDQTLDLEGDNTQWDIVFTKYMADLGFAFYPVSGVLSNRGYEVSEIHHAPGATPTLNDTLSFPFETNINTIGYDWKDAFAGIVHDTIVYYVKDNSGVTHQVKFTSYGGSSTGDMGFEVDGVAQNISLSAGNVDQVYYDMDTKSTVHTNTNNDWDVAFWAVSGTTDAPVRVNDVNGVELYVYPKDDITSWVVTSVNDVENQTTLLSTYPNPAEDHLNISLYAEGGNDVVIEIFDLNGRRVYTQHSEVVSGSMNTLEINVSSLNAGIYLLSVDAGGKKNVKRIVIQ